MPSLHWHIQFVAPDGLEGRGWPYWVRHAQGSARTSPEKVGLDGHRSSCSWVTRMSSPQVSSVQTSVEEDKIKPKTRSRRPKNARWSDSKSP